MEKIGFVGYGHMGGTILKALLKYGSLSAKQVVVMTRTESKLKDLVKLYPHIEVAHRPSEVAEKCRRVFICTGTKEVKGVLTELAMTGRDLHIITITAGIELKCLGSVYQGRITQIMPNMLIEVGEGITLVYHNNRVLDKDRRWINTLFSFSKISSVKVIQEEQMDLAADLTSCAPAFWACICEHLTRSALNQGNLSRKEIESLILPTMFGTGSLFLSKEMEFDEFVKRVATKGGITEEGIKVLEKGLPLVFDELLTVTLQKREIIKKRTRDQFGI